VACWDAVDTGYESWHCWGISWSPHCLARHELDTQRGCFEDLRPWGNLALVADPWETVVEVEQTVDGAEDACEV